MESVFARRSLAGALERFNNLVGKVEVLVALTSASHSPTSGVVERW